MVENIKNSREGKKFNLSSLEQMIITSFDTGGKLRDKKLDFVEFKATCVGGELRVFFNYHHKFPVFPFGSYLMWYSYFGDVTVSPSLNLFFWLF
jgi:hypothetical protein